MRDSRGNHSQKLNEKLCIKTLFTANNYLFPFPLCWKLRRAETGIDDVTTTRFVIATNLYAKVK